VVVVEALGVKEIKVKNSFAHVLWAVYAYKMGHWVLSLYFDTET
jgi:hypothetical protein